ncbi:hypothetical protein KCU73_g304, partial [Aureobasidium melanogenum]
MEQRKQTTRIHVPVLPDHPDENTNGSSVYTRFGSSSLYDSDGDDDEETDTYAAALSKGPIPDRTTQSPLGPSSGLTPDMDSVTEGCGTSDTSGFPKALGSQKASVIEGQTSATERDETVEKDKSKRDSQTSHILTTCLNTIGNGTMIELGKVRDSLKHTTIKGRSAERVAKDRDNAQQSIIDETPNQLMKNSCISCKQHSSTLPKLEMKVDEILILVSTIQNTANSQQAQISKIDSSLNHLSRSVPDRDLDKAEYGPLCSVDQTQPIGSMPNRMDARESLLTKVNPANPLHRPGYQIRMSSGTSPHNSGQRPVGGSVALKDHGPPNFSGLSELEGTAKQVENPEYSRKSQPAVQGVGKRQDSRDLTRETLLSAPEFERGLKFASILSQKPPSKVLEDVDQGLVNEFNRIPVTTWSLGLDTDGNADPRMTRECSQASSTADRALGTNGLRKSGAFEQGPRARRLSRKDYGPLEQDYRGDEGSFTDTRKRSGTFFKSDSSNRPKDEAEDFDRGRRSIAIPSRLVKTAQLLKEWAVLRNSEIISVRDIYISSVFSVMAHTILAKAIELSDADHRKLQRLLQALITLSDQAIGVLRSERKSGSMVAWKRLLPRTALEHAWGVNEADRLRTMKMLVEGIIASELEHPEHKHFDMSDYLQQEMELTS